MKYQIINGDNRAVLKTFPDNHFDSVVTDPPYGIDFLGKSWDANTGALETYQECLRVLKPGGHILAFSAARTYHHLAITLEQAGFEIRDQIMWIYSSGFPKSQDVGKSIQRSLGVKETKASKGMNAYAEVKDKKGKEKWMNPGNITTDDYPEKKDTVVCTDPEAQAWAGWGTALKPAHEPIALARKPIRGSIKDNVLKHGVGALNIDATRVPTDQPPNAQMGPVFGAAIGGADPFNNRDDLQHYEPHQGGRFPSNVLGDIPDYQKYFYCPKVSRRERHTGFELPPAMFGGVQGCYDENGERFAVGLDARSNPPTEQSMLDAMGGYYIDNGGNRQTISGKDIVLPDVGYIKVHSLKEHYANWCKKNNITPNLGNNHPTVKPIELMKYLIKLITPVGGRVLDPFNGSGSTGCAAVELGCEYVGIELDPKYVEIATKRIAAWNKQDTAFNDLFV